MRQADGAPAGRSVRTTAGARVRRSPRIGYTLCRSHVTRDRVYSQWVGTKAYDSDAESD
jgi:hypothetical protein